MLIDMVCVLSHLSRQATDIWAQGLTHAKFLIKGLRDWDKGKSKHSKFMQEVCPHLLVFSKFLKNEVGVTGHSSFQLLVHRAAFYTAAAEASEQGLSPTTTALAKAVEGGLPSLFAQEAAEARAAGRAAPSTTPDGWFRTPFLHTFASVLNDAGDEQEESGRQVKKLLDDVQSVARLLQGNFADSADTQQTLQHFEAILMCTVSPDAAHGEGVNSALLHFEEAPMQTFRQVVEETSAGQGLFLAAACFVQESAKGAAGVAKLDLAAQKLGDPRLPSLEPVSADEDDEGNLKVKNGALLLDGGVVSVMEESTQLVAEALALWTPPQLDREGDKVLVWLQLLADKLCLWDACMSAWLPAFVLAPAFEYGLLGDGAEPVDGAETNALEEIGGRLERDPVDEAPVQAFVRSVVKLCDDLPATFRLKPACVECANNLSAGVLPNSAGRKQMLEVIELVCTCPAAPASIDDMVMEWTNPDAAAEAEPCFLRYAVELLRTTELLAGTKLTHGPFGDGVDPGTALEFTFGPEGEQYSGSATQAMELPEWVRELAFVRQLGGKVAQCVETVLRKFAAAAHLPAARVPTHLAGGVAGRTAREVLAPFFHTAALQGAAESAATAASAEWRWAVDGLADLLRGLLEVIPPSSFTVSLGPLCAEGSSTTACSEKGLVLGACALFASFSKVVACAAYVTKKFVLDGGSCVVKHSLRSEVESCVGLLRKQVAAILSTLVAGGYGDATTLSQWPLVLTIADVRTWLHGFEEVLPVLSRHVVVSFAEDIGGLTAELSKATPRIEHVVSNTMYSPSLAAKHILGWPSRELMSQLCVAMSRSLSTAVRLQGAWDIQPALEEDSATKDTMALARSVFDTAKEALTVTAALNVLHELHGRARADKAASLLKTKKTALPKSLWGPLEKAAAATNASASGAPSVSAGDGAGGPMPLTDA